MKIMLQFFARKVMRRIREQDFRVRTLEEPVNNRLAACSPWMSIRDKARSQRSRVVWHTAPTN